VIDDDFCGYGVGLTDYRHMRQENATFAGQVSAA
jgi:hypothetical protein